MFVKIKVSMHLDFKFVFLETIIVVNLKPADIIKKAEQNFKLTA